MTRVLGRWRAEILMWLVATLAYAPGLWWGLPIADRRERVDVWSPDDIAPLAPLTELYNTFVASGPDRFLQYPLFHHALLVVAYAPYLLTLLLTGRLGTPSPVYPFGLADPVSAFRALTVIARCVSVAMGASIPVIAYRIGCSLWDRSTGLAAFALAFVPYPMWYYSKTANLDVPVLFWSALGILAYVQIVTKGVTVWRFGWLGAFAALAAATKDQGAAVFLLLPIVLLPLHIRAVRAGRVSRFGPPTALLVTGLLVYAIACGLAVDPGRYFAHIAFLATPEVRDSGFRDFVDWYPATASGVAELVLDVGRALFWFLGPLALAAAAVATAWAFRRHRPTLALTLPAMGHLVTFLVPIQYFYVRFAMPIMFVVSVLAARGLTLALTRISWRSARVTLVAATLLWPAVLSANLVFEMITDSRYDAGRWMAQHTRPTDRIAHCAPLGELPHFDPDIRTVRLTTANAVTSVIALRPEFVIVQPDWRSPPGMPHSGACPGTFYEALDDGTLGYRPVASFHAPSLVEHRLLDYPSVNPPVRVFARIDRWDRD